MSSKQRWVLGGIAAAMVAVLVAGVLAATDTISLPGSLREDLGLAQETPNPPCHLGLYRNDPKSPPAPAGHWRNEPKSPQAQVEGSAVAVGPIIYTTNGSGYGPDGVGDLRRVLAYDTRTRKWSEPTEMPVGLNHSHPVTYKGDIYWVGGYLEGETPTNRFWRYDPEADRWSELKPMTQPRGGGGVAVIGDKLYVASGAPQTFGVGTGPTAPYGTFEIYDFKTGRWTTAADMPDPRHHVGAAALDGKLYVAGGRDDTDHSSTEFDRYDPATGKWERLPHLPLGVATPGMTAAGGKIVVSGGEDQVDWENGGGWVTPSAWAFDPATNKWTRLPNHTIERRAHGTVTVGDRIYSLMGSYCPGLKPDGPVGTHTVESLPVSALNN